MNLVQHISPFLIIAFVIIGAVLFIGFRLYEKLRLPVVLLTKEGKKIRKNFQKLEFLVWALFLTIVLFYAIKSSILVTLTLLLIVTLAFFIFWKNYFAGIPIKFGSNFDLGDSISVNGISGVVTGLGNTNITILSTIGEETLIPYSALKSEIKIKQKSIPKVLYKTMVIEGENDSSHAYKQKLQNLLNANPYIIVTKPYSISIEEDKTTAGFHVLDDELYEKAKRWMWRMMADA